MLSRLTSAQNSLGWRQKSQWSVGLLCLQMRNRRDWSWLNPQVRPFGAACLIKGFVSRSAFNSQLAFGVWVPERKKKMGIQSRLGGQLTHMGMKAQTSFIYFMLFNKG